MKRSALDVLYGLGLLLLAGYFLWLTMGEAPPDATVVTNPYWYPRILLGFLALLAAGVMFRAVMSDDAHLARSPRWAALFVAMTSVGGYALIFYWFGFVVSTVIFLPLFAMLLGYRNLPVLTVATPTVTAIIWYAFYYGLGSAPPGLGLPVF